MRNYNNNDVCHSFFSNKALLKTSPEAGRCLVKPIKMLVSLTSIFFRKSFVASLVTIGVN